MNKFRDILIGPAIPTRNAAHERLSIPIGLAILSSDVLSSAAYATDELLAVLVIGGSLALNWALPLSGIIILLLAVLVLSYRQLIRAYPSGGGAYTVAKENLGQGAGLIAASGLLIDYILTVSVSIAAGVDALVSAFPVLAAARIELGLVFLLVLIIGNLRGIRESGRTFSIPTLMFVVTIILLLAAGLTRYAFGLRVAVAPTVPTNLLGSVSFFLVLRAFSSGCTALTGTEAISNGVLVFKRPEVENARKTMLFMGIVLGILFLGITFLARLFNIMPSGNQTVLSQIAHIVFGTSPLYYLVQFTTLFILIMAANTSFADFPRVASMLGRDRYLPNQLSDVGSRLVYSNGIVLLGVLGGILLIIFRGSVASLIPLYCVGVFISFTLSQAGMAKHWYLEKGPHWLRSAIVNGTGCIFTTCALIVIAVTKFTHGAWFVLILIPLCLYLFSRIHGHYEGLESKISVHNLESMPLSSISRKHKVVLLVDNIDNILPAAIPYARTLSGDVSLLYVNYGEPKEFADKKNELLIKWPSISTIVLQSTEKARLTTTIDYLREIKNECHNVTVILSEMETSGKVWTRLQRYKNSYLFKRAILGERIPVVSLNNKMTPLEENLPSVSSLNAVRRFSKRNTVVILVSGMRRGLIQALQYSKLISDDVRTVYVDCEGEVRSKEVLKQWSVYLPYIPLTVLPAPNRDIIEPVGEYLKEIGKDNSLITVIIPELSTGKWWTYVLHRNTAARLNKFILNSERFPVLRITYKVTKHRIRVVSPYRTKLAYSPDIKIDDFDAVE